MSWIGSVNVDVDVTVNNNGDDSEYKPRVPQNGGECAAKIAAIEPKEFDAGSLVIASRISA